MNHCFKSKARLSGLVIMLFLVLAGCNTMPKPTKVVDGKLKVAVSIVPEQTFVKAVCGDFVDIITMIPPGSSPETYEPTPQQMQEFSQASLYFSIGVPTEAASILPNAQDLKVVALATAAAAVYPDRMFATGERDPHIWLSPRRVVIMIETIAREVSGLDPAHQAVYQSNAQSYIRELQALDQKISAAVEKMQAKKFIVYHPAFGYLAEDYGLTMYALEEEGKEATAKHLQEMVDLAKREKIKVIFYQEEIDSRQSEAFAEEIGGTTRKLAPLAADYLKNLESMAEAIAGVTN
ncbi:MAG: zinc ABC transporter substrate-binding protein [Negativicutes bacterium]|nr:zinc ABC transporter substrate-binding protein [Negativicutes bacterium]